MKNLTAQEARELSGSSPESIRILNAIYTLIEALAKTGARKCQYQCSCDSYTFLTVLTSLRDNGYRTMYNTHSQQILIEW